MIADEVGIVERLEQGVPKHFLVEADGVVADEDRWRPGEELLPDGTDHIVVSRQVLIQQLRYRQSISAESRRMRHDMRKQARSDLEAIDLVQIPIRPDRGEMHDLVEARLQAGGLGIEN